MAVRRKQPRVRQAPKVLRLEDPLRERNLIFLRWLEANGGDRQEKLEVIATETSIHVQAIPRLVRWLELYGAVHVIVTPPTFGQGAVPHRYVQLLSVADYERDALALREAVREKLRPKPKSTSNRLPRAVLIEPDEWAAITERAKAEVATAIAEHGKLPPLDAAPLSYEDVSAWGAFGG